MQYRQNENTRAKNTSIPGQCQGSGQQQQQYDSQCTRERLSYEASHENSQNNVCPYNIFIFSIYSNPTVFREAANLMLAGQKEGEKKIVVSTLAEVIHLAEN